MTGPAGLLAGPGDVLGAGCAPAAGPLPVGHPESVEDAGEQVLAGIPRHGITVDCLGQRGLGGKMPYQYADAAPGQSPSAQVTQRYAVVALEVRFEGASVLGDEPAEASDSPSVTP